MALYVLKVLSADEVEEIYAKRRKQMAEDNTLRIPVQEVQLQILLPQQELNCFHSQYCDSTSEHY